MNAGSTGGPTPVRGYVAGPYGQIHVVTAGPVAGAVPQGPPVLLLHQTPRSVDEFAELVPLLAPTRRVIAMDTTGFGASDPPPEHTVGNYATCALALLDALGIDRVDVLGHHTGAVIAVEMARVRPSAARRLVLSSTPYHRIGRSVAERSSLDHAEPAVDGSHLVSLWEARRPMYPAGRFDLLNRVIRDILTAGPASSLGHDAVARYDIDTALGAIECPVLLIGASSDPYSFRNFDLLKQRMPLSGSIVIDGGMVGLMEVRATEVAEVMLEFLAASADDASHFYGKRRVCGP